MSSKDEKKAFTTLDTYRILGRSGLRVSPLCLGCMTFGEDWSFGSNHETSRKVYDVYREKGGNFFDTANAYTNGTSEKFLGEYIEGHRSQVVVATKFTANGDGFKAIKGQLTTKPNPNAGGNHKKSMVENLDLSLQRLGVRALDIFYLHFWENSTPSDEIIRGLDDVVRSGKAYHVAVSDAPAWFIARSNTIAELRGWSSFVALQTRYNLIERSYEGDLKSLTDAFSIATVTWGAIAEGFLTGKHTKESLAAGTGRAETVTQHSNNEKNWRILDEVKKVAEEIGATPAQVSINWLLEHGVTSPIIGARTPEQLIDNLGSLDFKLTPEQLQRLDEVSKPTLAFPFAFINRGTSFTDAGAKVDRHRTCLY